MKTLEKKFKETTKKRKVLKRHVQKLKRLMIILQKIITQLSDFANIIDCVQYEIVVNESLDSIELDVIDENNQNK